MRISDWSSDVCSSDLVRHEATDLADRSDVRVVAVQLAVHAAAGVLRGTPARTLHGSTSALLDRVLSELSPTLGEVGQRQVRPDVLPHPAIAVSQELLFVHLAVNGVQLPTEIGRAHA